MTITDVKMGIPSNSTSLQVVDGVQVGRSCTVFVLNLGFRARPRHKKEGMNGGDTMTSRPRRSTRVSDTCVGDRSSGHPKEERVEDPHRNSGKKGPPTDKRKSPSF